GGPDSVYREGAPLVPAATIEMGPPVLGICYGMQLMTHRLGGRVEEASGREFGPAVIDVVDGASPLFRGLPARQKVWASHGDRVLALPAGFSPSASSENAPFAAVEDRARRLFGVQFHPEVLHTEQGSAILRNFLFEVCGCRGDWTIGSFLQD